MIFLGKSLGKNEMGQGGDCSLQRYIGPTNITCIPHRHIKQVVHMAQIQTKVTHHMTVNVPRKMMLMKQVNKVGISSRGLGEIYP